MFVQNVVAMFGAHFSVPSPSISLLYNGRSLKLDIQSLDIYGISILCPRTMEE